TREVSGRRINLAVPEASLILLKGTGVVPHGGGVVMQEGSREYKLLLDWIRAGAPGPSKSDPDLKRLGIPPAAKTMAAGDQLHLQVNAEYSDGTTADVTWLAQFESNDVTVAEVSRAGQVKMLRPGETAIRASFLGHVTIALMTAPHQQAVDPAAF